MQRWKLIWMVLPALVVASLPAVADTEVRKEVIAAGGGRSGNGTHTLLCTVGQPCVGKMASSEHVHLIGFLEPGGTVVSAVEGFLDLPLHPDLAQNYPNPFTPATTIGFALPESRHVRLEIFSIEGRRVACLLDGSAPAGHLAVTWDGKDARGRPVAAGAYLYRLTAGDFTATHRMLLTR